MHWTLQSPSRIPAAYFCSIYGSSLCCLAGLLKSPVCTVLFNRVFMYPEREYCSHKWLVIEKTLIKCEPFCSDINVLLKPWQRAQDLPNDDIWTIYCNEAAGNWKLIHSVIKLLLLDMKTIGKWRHSRVIEIDAINNIWQPL